ncbi:MAG: DUF2851 family protein [Terrimicrobiaceae bacterium]|nr:DUF2851 family protein [Terrimicrobiaceae bacterium]
MNAGDYERARLGRGVNESLPARRSEIEIQARLFAGEYGSHWKTTGGQAVEVLHFGQWNREAGPDFKGARLRFGGEEECSGDVEVDMDARDWERHGHATNPAYDGVRLQLFVHQTPSAAFARASDFREVPQAHLSIEAPSPPVLHHVPGSVDRESALVMIEEAAEFRLRMKHAAHARAVTLHGAETALFHSLATGLGYKNNGIPFLLAAQRTGLRTASGPEGEARLFGISGFLQPTTFDEGDPATKDYLKPLWEKWWGIRDNMARLVLPQNLWRFSGIRPSNHPHRRMGALAAAASHFPQLLAGIRSGGKQGFGEFFESLPHPYWSRHWNLSAAKLDGEVALVGADRVRDLLVNAFFPSLPIEKAREEMKALRGGTPSGRLKKASGWLVGSIDSQLMRTARQQQGLLQLFADFGSLSAIEAWGKIQKP